MLHNYHEGNPSCQMIHDGATLKDHGKRLAMGAELIMVNPRYVPREMPDLTPPPARPNALVAAAQGGHEKVKAKPTPTSSEYDKPSQHVLSRHGRNASLAVTPMRARGARG